MKEPKEFNSLITKLFHRDDFTRSISEAIEKNQHFNSKLIEVTPTELGPEIWLKAKDENEIISAAKEITKVYKQNLSLRRKIYTGLKIDFPSFYYKNQFGDFGYKGESEEIKDRAAAELIEAIQASESVVHSTKNGEISFGRNPVADVFYSILYDFDRKRFPERKVEIEPKVENQSFIEKHKKALSGIAIALGLGSCIVYPSIVKGQLTFDPSLTINHLTKISPYILQNMNFSIYSLRFLSSPPSLQREDFLKRNWKKFMVLIPVGLGALSFYLDASSTTIDLPYFNVKIPGLLNAIKAKAYSDSTGLDWNRSLDLALHTDTLNFLSGVFGKETEFSKAIHVYNEIQVDKESAYNLLKLFLQDGKISQDEIQTAHTYGQLYKELNADKDSNAYNLLKLFLQDGKISQDEITATSYYLRTRDNLIPEKLLPFWSFEERGQLAYEFCRQLLLDGKITEEEKRIADLMLNFRKPMVTVWGIKEGVILDIYKDHDNDGFSTYEELLAGKDYLNPLETPLTNDSEVYIIIVNGSGGGYYAPDMEAALIFQYYALKYGIPEDHITYFAKYRQAGDRWQGDPLERVSPYRKEFFPEIKGHLLKDYPLKINYLDENCTKANLIEEIKRVLQLTDSNDVIYIHNSGEGPGFKLFNGSGPLDYEMIYIPDMVNIMKSTPREGKLILVNETCGAEWYVRTLRDAMIREGSPLKDYVGIGAVSEKELSTGIFDFIFLSKLRDGYSIRDAVPLEFRELDEVSHPVIYLGEGNYDWIKYYNPFK